MTAARLGVAAGALLLAGAAGWWLLRAEPLSPAPGAPPVIVAAPPGSPAPDPVPRAEDPPAPPRKPARRPPRFVTEPAPAAPAPTPPATDGHALGRESPLLLDAISGAAHGSQVTPEEFLAGTTCIRELGKRKAALIGPDSTIRGTYVVTVATTNQQSRVVQIEGKGGEDQEMFDCLRKNRVWLSGQPFPAPGAPDGTVRLEWPYRVATKPSAPARPS
jgi:hypothetical protein